MSHVPDTRYSLLVKLRDVTDGPAWTEFLEIYRPVIHRLARRKGFQDADAEDVTQEAFAAVARAIDRWHENPARGPFRAWLFTIARNLMINSLNKSRRTPRATGDDEVQRALAAIPAPCESDWRQFERECEHSVFQWAAEQIRDEFREATWQAFWRTAVLGESVADTAAQLGISAGAVYVAKSRVMARLKQKVQRLQGAQP